MHLSLEMLVICYKWKVENHARDFRHARLKGEANIKNFLREHAENWWKYRYFLNNNVERPAYTRTRPAVNPRHLMLKTDMRNPRVHQTRQSRWVLGDDQWLLELHAQNHTISYTQYRENAWAYACNTSLPLAIMLPK